MRLYAWCLHTLLYKSARILLFLHFMLLNSLVW
jgi:hypothetical protein